MRFLPRALTLRFIDFDPFLIPHHVDQDMAVRGPLDLADLEFHDDFGRAGTVSGRRHIGGVDGVPGRSAPPDRPTVHPAPHSHTIAITAIRAGFRHIINELSLNSLTRLAVRTRPPQNWSVNADE